MKEGFKVEPGEKSVAVKSLRLFHRSQVQPVSKTEQAEYFAKLEAKKSDRFLPNGSPVSTQPAPTPVPLKPSKPQPKSEPEVEAAKKSKAGRSKPDGTGPQPIV
jgi:hypothetical protein